MTKKLERVITKSMVAGTLLAPVGLAIWRVIRRKSKASGPDRIGIASKSPELNGQASSHADTPSGRQDEEELESLSSRTPGDAPLDRLARMADQEKRVEDRPGLLTLKTPTPPGSDHPCPAEEKTVATLLEHQSLAAHRLEGWSVPEPERLPVPTYAPAVMAFGIVVFAMGLATVWYVCVVGALVFVIAAWRWTGELQGE